MCAKKTKPAKKANLDSMDEEEHKIRKAFKDKDWAEIKSSTLIVHISLVCLRDLSNKNAQFHIGRKEKYVQVTHKKVLLLTH